MTFSARPHLIRQATLNYLLYILYILLLYKMIYSNKFDLFWTATLFLYYNIEESALFCYTHKLRL